MNIAIIALAIAIPFVLLIGLVMALKKMDSVEADNSELRFQHGKDSDRIAELEELQDSVEKARDFWRVEYKDLVKAHDASPLLDTLREQAIKIKDLVETSDQQGCEIVALDKWVKELLEAKEN